MSLRPAIQQLRLEVSKQRYGYRVGTLPWDLVGDVAVSLLELDAHSDLGLLLHEAFDEQSPTLLKETLFPDLKIWFGVVQGSWPYESWRSALPVKMHASHHDYIFRVSNLLRGYADPLIPAPHNFEIGSWQHEFRVVTQVSVADFPDEVLPKGYQRLLELNKEHPAYGEMQMQATTYDLQQFRFWFDFLSFWHHLRDHTELCHTVGQLAKRR